MNGKTAGAKLPTYEDCIKADRDLVMDITEQGLPIKHNSTAKIYLAEQGLIFTSPIWIHIEALFCDGCKQTGFELTHTPKFTFRNFSLCRNLHEEEPFLANFCCALFNVKLSCVSLEFETR